jgi:hypothetical protein
MGLANSQGQVPCPTRERSPHKCLVVSDLKPASRPIPPSRNSFQIRQHQGESRATWPNQFAAVLPAILAWLILPSPAGEGRGAHGGNTWVTKEGQHMGNTLPFHGHLPPRGQEPLHTSSQTPKGKEYGVCDEVCSGLASPSTPEFRVAFLSKVLPMCWPQSVTHVLASCREGRFSTTSRHRFCPPTGPPPPVMPYRAAWFALVKIRFVSQT